MSGRNVWIKSGATRDIMVDKTTTGAVNTQFKYSPHATFQATVTGTGAVTATVDIEVSNDGTNWLDTVAGTITLSGTTTHSDGFTTTSAPWKYVRANVTAISGTSASVDVVMGV
jgi:hypothetical protein